MKSMTRSIMKQRLITAAQIDERIVGLIDYGSSSQGRDDELSDIDADVFIGDADFEAFDRDWKSWAAQFGNLLLAYKGSIGHPWAVYEAVPVPLRVDFDFHRESEIEQILSWPYSPQSMELMVWYDGSGGRIIACVQQLVEQSLRPVDVAATFEKVSGDFWYYMLYTFCKWRRGQGWLARQTFHFQVMQNLLLLLRLEAGALDYWQSSPAAWNIEHTLSSERLKRLEGCIPGPGMATLKQSLAAAALLGYDACKHIAELHGWEWPQRLAKQILRIVSE
jgi:lincosamide nucleotidyltransferase